MKKRDQTILDALETGNNQKCLALLYKHSLPKICDYVKKNNGSLDQAKDIFQDSVLVFYKHVKSGKFNKENDIDAFLFAVARNRWINLSKRKNLVFTTETLPDLISDEEVCMLKRLSDHSRKEGIEELMNLVGEKCRELLTLFIYEEKKLREITEIMDLENEGAAKSTIYRCRQKLVKLVNENSWLMEKLKY